MTNKNKYVKPCFNDPESGVEVETIALADIPATYLKLPQKEGANGGVMGFNSKGQLVEWVEDEDGGMFFGMVCRRSDAEIAEAVEHCWDIVWWGRSSPDDPRGAEGRARVEAKYGLEELRRHLSPFEWGLVSGRLSALAWVSGAPWAWSLDT